MRQCMDHIEYRSEGDENILFMEKGAKDLDMAVQAV